jgi:hypothetical protein
MLLLVKVHPVASGSLSKFILHHKDSLRQI